MSGTEDVKQEESVVGNAPEKMQKPMPSSEEEAAVKKKYGGIVPKKPPLISKDHERAYFDSADWALGKQNKRTAGSPSTQIAAHTTANKISQVSLCSIR